MRIVMFDAGSNYEMDVDICKHIDHEDDLISLELNNMHDNVKFPIPNETTFFLTIEDAKKFHFILGMLLKI